jgi:predicted dehydrogenase
MTQKPDPLRFAVVGLGFGESRCALIAENPETELVAVSARHEARAAAIAGRHGCAWSTDYRAVVERDDVDAVAVYTPNAAHLDIAVAAAAAGKHVVVCKPLEVTGERARAIVDACRAAEVRLAVEFDTHYHPASLKTYRAIAGGLLGPVFQGDYVNKTHRGPDYYASNGGWRRLAVEDGGGAVVNQGVHALDQMIWYQGEPVAVSAVARALANDIQADDTANAVVEFANGSMATFAVTTTFHNNRKPSRYGEGTMKRAEISGRDGSVTLVDDAITMWEFRGALGDEPSDESPATPANVFQDLAWHLGRPDYRSDTLVANEATLTAVRLVDAIYESARTRSRVEISAGSITKQGDFAR